MFGASYFEARALNDASCRGGWAGESLVFLLRHYESFAESRVDADQCE